MLHTFSFEPYFRSYFSFKVGSLEFSEIAKQSTLLLPPLSLSASPLSAQFGAARHQGGLQATSCFAHRHTRCPRDLLVPLSLALEPCSPRHATPTSSAAATSPSPWTARCRASAPQLARASVPGAIPFHFPLLASPAPCPNPQNIATDNPNAGELEAHHRPAPPKPLRLL